MTEASLTQKLIDTGEDLMPFSVGLKISDRFNTGYPDFNWTWARVSSWWEVKFYNDRMFEDTEVQRITCRRLAQVGLCHYIIYERRGHMKRVLVMTPDQYLAGWEDAPDFAMGFDHVWVSAFIRHLHLKDHRVNPNADHR